MAIYRGKRDIYHKYGTFKNLRKAYDIAWKMKKQNRKLRYKITKEEYVNGTYYCLWIANRTKW